MDVATDTPLARMARTTPTEYWNDSCAVAELEDAIAHGAVGATSNPTIVGEVLRKELDTWRPRVRVLRTERPTATDVEITWAVAESDFTSLTICVPEFPFTQIRPSEPTVIAVDPTWNRIPT